MIMKARYLNSSKEIRKYSQSHGSDFEREETHEYISEDFHSDCFFL